MIGCAEHHEIAARIADRTIALLKDTAGTLAAGSGPAPADTPLLPGERARLHRGDTGVQAGRDRGADRGRLRGERLQDGSGAGRRRAAT